MPKLIDHKQRTPEWFAWRKNKISASMLPTIMGLNPYETPLQLYNQLMSGEQKEMTPAMQRGVDLEPKARLCAENYFTCSYPEACIEDAVCEYFIASMDGFNADGKVPAIEIKCLGEKGHSQSKLGVVPPQYWPQLQWQMYVAGIQEMYYFSYAADNDFEVIKVKKDRAFLDKAVEAAHEFRRCLIDFIPPEPSDRDLIAIDDAEAVLIAADIAEMQLNIRQMTAKSEELRRRLKEICQDRSSVIGDTFRFVKSVKRGAVDYKAIPELELVDLEKYRKAKIESWRFS